MSWSGRVQRHGQARTDRARRHEPAVEVRVHRDVHAGTLAAIGGVTAAIGGAAGAVAGWRLGRRRDQPVQSGRDFGPPTAAAKQRGGTRGDATRQRRANPVLRRLDGLQQRRPVLGFPIAVAKKFGEDQAGSLAGLIAYYGFLSLFPLLLALTTVLALVLEGDPELQERVLDSALAQFPVIGDQIRENVQSLEGSGVALAVGIAGAIWGGMGVMRTAGNAMDEVWEVPKRDRPKFLRALVRAAGMLVVLGGGVVATTVLSGLGTSGGSTLVPLRVAGVLLAAVANVAVFLLGFRVLTVRDVGWRQLWPAPSWPASAGRHSRPRAATTSPGSCKARARPTACSPSSSACCHGCTSSPSSRWSPRGAGHPAVAPQPRR